MRIKIVQFVLVFGIGLQDLGLGRRQDAIKAAQDGEGQDDVLIFAALERVPDEVGHTPDETDDFAVIHSVPLRAASEML